MSTIEKLQQKLNIEKEDYHPLIRKYFDELRPLIQKYPIYDARYDARIVGSFGRNDPAPSSDLDSWIITDGRLSLKTVTDISDEESTIKEKVSRLFNFPEITRHRATIVDKDDAKVYESIHSVRVGLPFSLGEAYSLREVYFPIINISDVIVSLREFKHHYSRATSDTPKRKFTNYALRDFLYFSQAIRLSKDMQLADYITQNYSGSEFLVWADIETYIHNLSRQVTEEQILARDFAHGCMFTYGKVQWDLIESFRDRDRFDKWRFGQERHCGFFPSEIIEFVDSIRTHFPTGNTKQYLQLLGKLQEGNISNNILTDFCEIHTSWMMVNGNNLLAHS